MTNERFQSWAGLGADPKRSGRNSSRPCESAAKGLRRWQQLDCTLTPSGAVGTARPTARRPSPDGLCPVPGSRRLGQQPSLWVNRNSRRWIAQDDGHGGRVSAVSHVDCLDERTARQRVHFHRNLQREVLGNPGLGNAHLESMAAAASGLVPLNG